MLACVDLGSRGQGALRRLGMLNHGATLVTTDAVGSVKHVRNIGLADNI
jgi:hypothetical protein